MGISAMIDFFVVGVRAMIDCLNGGRRRRCRRGVVSLKEYNLIFVRRLTPLPIRPRPRPRSCVPGASAARGPPARASGLERWRGAPPPTLAASARAIVIC